MRAGHEQRSLDPCHPRLRGTVEIRVKNRNPKPPSGESAGEMKSQGALADAPLAGSHGHKMTHPGEPVGNARALLGDLLEDP